MPCEKWLVDGHVLDGDDPLLAVQFKHAIVRDTVVSVKSGWDVGFGAG